MKPVPVLNPYLGPERRELGLYAGFKSGTLKVGLPPRHTQLLGWTHEDAVIVSVWEREDGEKVLVLEKDKLNAK